MIVIITNNHNTIDMMQKYIDIRDCVVENLKEKLSVYIDNEFLNRNLEKVDKIIIDITNFIDTKEEILKAITKIKIIYDIQIIIIALNRKVGDELLSDLFNIGIYDYIISNDEEKQNEEWIKSLNKNNYIDAVKFKIDKNETKKVKKISKSKLRKNLNKKDEQVSKKILSCFLVLKNELSYALTFIWYVILTILVSVGATALLNSNIRQLIIEVLQGGK